MRGNFEGLIHRLPPLLSTFPLPPLYLSFYRLVPTTISPHLAFAVHSPSKPSWVLFSSKRCVSGVARCGLDGRAELLLLSPEGLFVLIPFSFLPVITNFEEPVKAGVARRLLSPPGMQFLTAHFPSFSCEPHLFFFPSSPELYSRLDHLANKVD